MSTPRYEMGPCGVPWPVATLDEPPAPPTPATKPEPDPGDPGHCAHPGCDGPLAWTSRVPQTFAERIGNTRVHAWRGRSGNPEHPYDHDAQPDD